MHSVVLRHAPRQAGRRLILLGRCSSISQGNNVLWWGVRRRLLSSNYNETTSLLAGETAAATNRLRPAWYTKYILATIAMGGYVGYRSIYVVDVGQVAVVEVLGQVQETMLRPGVHVVEPWAKVSQFPVQTQRLILPTKTRIRGGLFVELEMGMEYRLDESKLPEIYRQQGPNATTNWQLQAVARSILHATVAKKSMEQLHETQQLAIGTEIQKQLNELYEPRGLKVTQVVFPRVQLPEYLVTAIQDLHQLDLEISADKRIVDGKLAVARGTAAARNVLKNEEASQKNSVPNLPQVTKTIQPVLAKNDNEDGKNKKLLEKVFPFFFGDKKDAEKKLPTLNAYVKEVKEDRGVLESVFPYFFGKTKKAEEKRDHNNKQTKEETEVVPPKVCANDNKGSGKAGLKATSDNDKKVEGAKLPPLKAMANDDNNKKVEEAKLPPTSDKPDLKDAALATTAAEPPLQEATANKAKAAGETEKES